MISYENVNEEVEKIFEKINFEIQKKKLPLDKMYEPIGQLSLLQTGCIFSQKMMSIANKILVATIYSRVYSDSIKYNKILIDVYRRYTSVNSLFQVKLKLKIQDNQIVWISEEQSESLFNSSQIANLFFNVFFSYEKKLSNDLN